MALTMQAQLERILQKLESLRLADSKLGLFGASAHGYVLHPVLTESELHAFEREYDVELPADYAAFLTTLGNGGAGPYYGLKPLQESRIRHFNDRDDSGHAYFDLGKPFPYTAPWNVSAEINALYDQIEAANTAGDDELEESLLDLKWALIDLPELDQGRIQLCDYGCGISISLVVKGPDRGTVWTDGRVDDGGLYPSTELGHTDKTGFLDWYESWLDQWTKQFER